jgi:hypothetical protein
MAVVAPFIARPGTLVPYPGLRQTGNTCVLVSIASAVNWLSQSTLTELEVVRWFQAASKTDVNFATVVSVVLPMFPNIEAIEYHDNDNPLSDVDGVLGRVQAGGVAILSLEVAGSNGVSIQRHGLWHMISVFKGGGSDAQVWDTNGFDGFLTWDELRELLTGDELAIPYLSGRFLLPHGQHHFLLVTRRWRSAEPRAAADGPGS